MAPDMNHDAVFVLSTGRCGTQWLHNAFSSLYGNQAIVTHEPIRTAYEPRQFFRADSTKLQKLGNISAVKNHVAYIRETLKTKIYIETGWAHFAALPWLYEALEGRMRVVHLYRNPVTTSFSLATQRLYERQDWVTASALSPHDARSFQSCLKEDWVQMSQYEKCLFYWTEIHLYGQHLKHQNPSWRWHDLRFEDLFGCNIFELRRLIEFSGLPFMPEIMKLQKQRTDNYIYKTNIQDWRLIERYPITCELAQGLGYNIANTNIKALADRYFPSWPSAIYKNFRNRFRATA
jgi:Sulfotransferase domain